MQFPLDPLKIPDKERKALGEFLDRVLPRYEKNVKYLILFGSYARGEQKDDSDMDLLLVVDKQNDKMESVVSEAVLDVLFETGVYLSVKTISLKEFSRIRRLKTPFYNNLSRDGIELWKAA